VMVFGCAHFGVDGEHSTAPIGDLERGHGATLRAELPPVSPSDGRARTGL
jgi:hypothetical protein